MLKEGGNVTITHFPILRPYFRIGLYLRLLMYLLSLVSLVLHEYISHTRLGLNPQFRVGTLSL